MTGIHHDEQAHDLLTVRELADYLRVSEQTIYTWRSQHRGPQALRLGRKVVFRKTTVDAWLEQQAEAS